MANKVKIELNSDGIRALLKSKETQDVLDQIARARAGGWLTDTKVLDTRAVASIYSTDYKEVAEELQNHTIVGGLGG